MAGLPDVVQRSGVAVNKSTRNFLLIFALVSEDGSMDGNDLRDYAVSNLEKVLARVPGVGEVQNFGAQYAMRVWLDPDKLTSYRMTVEDVQAALRAQREPLLADAERLLPSPRAYASLAFESNFVSNASVAMATFSLADGPRLPPLSALWAAAGRTNDERTAAEMLARALMGYATGDPARLGAHGAPLIVYDPFDGAHHVNVVRRALQEFA